MVYKKKKENCYIKCKECKKIFCTEEYDMASYKYRDKLGGRYIYFCSYNCMMRYKREKGQYKDKITEEKYEVEDVKLQNKRENVLRVYSPGGVQFYIIIVTESVTANRQKGVHYG